LKPAIALLVSVAVLAASANAIPAARAAQTRKAPAARASTVEKLRAQLHKTRVKLSHANAELGRTRTRLASSQQQVQSLTAQASQLQATLSQTQAALAASQAQAASLQAKLDAIPTPLLVAEEQVRREVAYSEGVLASAGVPYSHGQLVSQAAMDYVVGHVNAPAYGYLTTIANIGVPALPDPILSAQAGICGHAALTYAAILKHFGYAVRSVQFYYGPGGAWNHIADEVSYDGAWHYFDPTFGIYYQAAGNVLSITDARAADDPGSLLVQDDSLFWTAVVRQAQNTELSDVSFATDPATAVVIDGQPF
jgi:multidrug efflux pump subunit AcrA (membrane-fusion protein)